MPTLQGWKDKEQASNDAWNSYMNSSASKQNPLTPDSGSLMANVGKPRDTSGAYGPFITGTKGQQYRQLPASAGGGYVNVNTGETVSGFSKPSTGSNVTYSGGSGFGGGGGGGYSGGGGGGGSSPVEFYLGKVPTLRGSPNAPQLSGFTLGNLDLPNAPTLSGLDYSGVMDNFQSIFQKLNSGVRPSFGVDVNKIARDAKTVASQLNLSPGQIKDFIAGVNPSTGEILADTEKILSSLNNPAKIAATAGAIADSLNAKYKAEFEDAMPGYKTNMAKANALTSDYLAGKLPDDVVNQVFSASAAKGFSAGIFGGGLGRNLVAKDLGLTSLQLQSAGANLLQQTVGIANSVLQSTMPVTGEGFAARLITDPGQVFSTVANMRRVDPTSIFNAVYTPNREIFNTLSQMEQQSTMEQARFEASKLVPPATVLNALTQQAQFNQQINTQNLLNQWETQKTMAIANNQIAEKNAINKAQIYNENALNQFSVDQYNTQIANQNALNAWQGQGLPGQYDISRGQYIGFQPGTYSPTKPNLPGSMASGASGASGSSGDFMVNMGGKLVKASSLKGVGGQALVEIIRAGMDAQMAEQATNYTSSAYRPV